MKIAFLQKISNPWQAKTPSVISCFDHINYKYFYIFKIQSAGLNVTISLPETMELKVYPNPADEYIIIETGFSEPSTFKIFDFIGNMVLYREVSDKERISIKDLEEGIYYYKLVANTRLQAGKLRLYHK